MGNFLLLVFLHPGPIDSPACFDEVAYSLQVPACPRVLLPPNDPRRRRRREAALYRRSEGALANEIGGQTACYSHFVAIEEAIES